MIKSIDFQKAERSMADYFSLSQFIKFKCCSVSELRFKAVLLFRLQEV
jgi:hypothetical protein